MTRVHRMSPGPDRWKERSRFFPGVAEAMADQWGGHRNGKLGWSFSESVLPYDLYAFRFPVVADGKPCGDPEWVKKGDTE